MYNDKHQRGEPEKRAGRDCKSRPAKVQLKNVRDGIANPVPLTVLNRYRCSEDFQKPDRFRKPVRFEVRND